MGIIKTSLVLLLLAFNAMAFNDDCANRLNQKIEFNEFSEILSALEEMEETKVYYSGYISKSSMIKLKKKIIKKFTEANGGPIKINVKLKSLGGEIYWANDMVKFMNKLNQDPKIEINTEVRSECESSCTILFTGGKNRYASKYAKFGFHKPTLQSGSLENMTKDEVEEMFRQIWIRSIRNVDPEVSVYLSENDYFKYQEMKYLRSKELLTGYVTQQR